MACLIVSRSRDRSASFVEATMSSPIRLVYSQATGPKKIPKNDVENRFRQFLADHQGLMNGTSGPVSEQRLRWLRREYPVTTEELDEDIRWTYLDQVTASLDELRLQALKRRDRNLAREIQDEMNRYSQALDELTQIRRCRRRLFESVCTSRPIEA
jgi:hypothetical protein